MAVISDNITDAANHLRSGKLIGLPTETVYGLAGNALDPEVVVNIFKVKDRPSFDPLIVHTNSLEKVRDLVKNIPDQAIKMAEVFWPGPLTLVLPKENIIPDIVTSGLSTVGIRIPNHPLTLKLLEVLEFPLAAPSANPFGYVSPTTAQHVNDQLGGKIPFILDGGPTRVGIESTIISFNGEQTRLLRLGGIELELIQKVIGPVQLELNQSSNPTAPGMLESHYAPGKKVILGDVHQGLLRFSHEKVGILSLNRSFSEVSAKHQIRLSETADMREAAQNLFAALRQFDSLDVEVILAEEMPEEGLGRAINDRLRRASR